MHRQVLTIAFWLSFVQQTVTGSVIIDGEKVSDGDMQYMASVQNIRGHVCSGFLVRDDFVLTAAHCLDQKPDTVVLGNHNQIKGKKIDITKEIKHPSYKKMNKANNLMLLKLKKKANLGNGVEIIQLPNENTNVKINEWCKIAGWGATRIGGANSKVLMAINVSIIDIPTCKKKWHSLSQNVICARGKDDSRTFNEGDCGGPLVCNNVAVGIASFNRDGEVEGPNVFVDIFQYLEWINKTVSVS